MLDTVLDEAEPTDQMYYERFVEKSSGDYDFNLGGAAMQPYAVYVGSGSTGPGLSPDQFSRYDQWLSAVDAL